MKILRSADISVLIDYGYSLAEIADMENSDQETLETILRVVRDYDGIEAQPDCPSMPVHVENDKSIWGLIPAF